jgi:hypothetical protein
MSIVHSFQVDEAFMIAATRPSIPQPDAWVAGIEPVEGAGGPDRQRPAYHLAAEFEVLGAIDSAYLFQNEK